MLTWVRLWVILPAPLLPLLLVGCIPAFEIMGKTLQGGIIRQWFVNHIALPLLPHDWAVQLVAWFEQASFIQELMLHLLISADLTLLLLPLMYLVGHVLISMNAWASTTDHSLKIKQVR